MPGYAGGWCDVDMRMLDRDPNIDFLDGMPHYKMLWEEKENVT